MSEARDIEREEQYARVDRMLAEREKLLQEALKLRREEQKLEREASKLERDRTLAPWQIVVTAMGTGAALFAAGAAFVKLLLT